MLTTFFYMYCYIIVYMFMLHWLGEKLFLVCGVFNTLGFFFSEKKTCLNLKKVIRRIQSNFVYTQYFQSLPFFWAKTNPRNFFLQYFIEIFPDEIKLDQETWLWRTNLDDFLVKLWTILDHIWPYHTWLHTGHTESLQCG